MIATGPMIANSVSPTTRFPPDVCAEDGTFGSFVTFSQTQFILTGRIEPSLALGSSTSSCTLFLTRYDFYVLPYGDNQSRVPFVRVISHIYPFLHHYVSCRSKQIITIISIKRCIEGYAKMRLRTRWARRIEAETEQTSDNTSRSLCIL